MGRQSTHGRSAYMESVLRRNIGMSEAEVRAIVTNNVGAATVPQVAAPAIVPLVVPEGETYVVRGQVLYHVPIRVYGELLFEDDGALVEV